MQLYLIRHAQSANNVTYGSDDHTAAHEPDPEITDAGHRQGELLGSYLAGPARAATAHAIELTHLYCSLMTRSLLTADYISRSCELPLTALDHVHEKKGLYRYDDQGQEVGVEGPNRRYFEERFPEVELPESLGSAGWWNRPRESEAEFFARMETSVDALMTEHGNSDDRVAVVAHGDYIDQFINVVMGVNRFETNYAAHWEANWVVHNTSISRIDVIGGSRNIVFLNRIDHLPDELITW